MTEPYLLFEFADEQGTVTPLAFTKPVKIFQTRKLEEIPQIMAEIELMIQQGHYAAGYVSYEAAPAFHAEMKVQAQSALPLLWFGIYASPSSQLRESEESRPYTVSPWKMAGSKEHYTQAISKIKQAIEEGYTYQVNYTERLHADFTGSDFSFYRQLTRNQQSAYSAYLNLGRYRLLSASPELFFKVTDHKITAKPMKGTASRGRFTAEDRANQQRLLESEKERAENLMIVDLLRNDIGQLAKSGTVEVQKLFDVETYPTVHQLTSTIQAEIPVEATVFDWFHALFPCGSITGAPKISTMDYIAELEQSPREVYCGAIGYITPEKNAVFNVPIRTVIVDAEQKNASYGVGGGITWDSTSDGEYQELYTKARLLTERRPEFQLLESLKLENGNYPLLSYHLDRIADSASYFQFPWNPEAINQLLADYAANHPEGIYKVRLLSAKNGELSLDGAPVSALEEPVYCTIAKAPIDRHDPFLFHKTTNRQVYEQHTQHLPDQAFSVLLWNEKEELTEFAIGNLVIEKGGRFFTPPVTSGLLAGTYRQFLLDRNELQEKVIYKDDLTDADAIWFINSVRGWLKVKLDHSNARDKATR